MSFLYDQQKIHQNKLERFRESFVILTQDGQYPPERQNRLYQATIQAGLDWNEARQFVRPDAAAFFQRHMTAVLAQGDLTPEAINELNRLRRRLGLDATATADLSRSSHRGAALSARPAIPTPAPSVSNKPSVWSDLKMILAGIILTPIIWFGLLLLTPPVLALLGMWISSAIISKLIPFISFLEFFLAIFFTVRLLRRWRRPTSAQAPASLPQQQGLPLPLNQFAPHPQHHAPRMLVSGSSLERSVWHLSGTQFEYWVGDRLVELGWQDVQVTGGPGDRGVDIRGNYHGKRCVVQCKHHPGRPVPPQDVRELVGTRNIQRAQRAYLITSGRFGHQCFREIYRRPVELWDLETLATHLNNRQVTAA